MSRSRASAGCRVCLLHNGEGAGNDVTPRFRPRALQCMPAFCKSQESGCFGGFVLFLWPLGGSAEAYRSEECLGPGLQLKQVEDCVCKHRLVLTFKRHVAARVWSEKKKKTFGTSAAKCQQDEITNSSEGLF